MITSAFFSSASLNARVKALGSSGLGAFTVGKFPSGFTCSGTGNTFFMPMRLRTVVTGTYPEPCSGV